MKRSRETRRAFIKRTAAIVAAGGGVLDSSRFGWSKAAGVTIQIDKEDPTVREAPVRWAAERFRDALQAKGVSCEIEDRPGVASSQGNRILVASAGSAVARNVMTNARISVPATAESLVLVRQKAGERLDLLACGTDIRGLVYGLFELADRVRHGGNPLAELRGVDRVVQRPANKIRSIARLFTSEPEDKPWFYDKSFWDAYLTMLAQERFNRFSLTLGLGYNSPRRVPDSYFYFAYPFLIAVPEYPVKARGLPDEERDRNLAMLRWIGDETKARGLHFQLGLWTHAYEFIDSPNVNYRIEGLTPLNHASYCRDAVQKLLETCPAIDGLTVRAHSESGIPQGSYEFWRNLFEGIARCGRRIEIDIHSKGIEHKLIDMALATGLPVQVSPKYWAEHMGLPYHQASIRELERARPGSGSAAAIEQQRRFTRYGYADYLREDRSYGVYYRIWPGTQRLLLWGDPAIAAGYGRYASFCGSLGLELCEPLSFKGRMGSGTAGGRELYQDPSLRPPGGDWEKYLYTYRLWGRLLYDPDEDPDCWRRLLQKEFGTAAHACEAALANASRILPLVTTAHDPSASNNRYWPEIYTNMPIVDPNREHHYGDTPIPKRFGTVSSLDPELFSRIDDFADEIVKGRRTGKYSPLEVASWLEGFARAAEDHLSRARRQVSNPKDASFRRLAVDVLTQSALGSFFAAKLRAAVAYALFERTKEGTALDEALKHYRAARAAWEKAVHVTKGVYRSDLTFGREPYLRGGWEDRLAAIDADLADMEARRAKAGTTADGKMHPLGNLAAALSPAETTRRPKCTHVPPASFRPGEPLVIGLSVERNHELSAVTLHYRRVNQAEEYQTVELSRQGERYRQTIPGGHSDSPYPLMYFFKLHRNDQEAWLYPGLEPDLSNQPYFVVRPAGETRPKSE